MNDVKVVATAAMWCMAVALGVSAGLTAAAAVAASWLTVPLAAGTCVLLEMWTRWWGEYADDFR